MRFRDLKVGDWFDFIAPNSLRNSFFKRVEKTGPRSYRDEQGTGYRVGSINVQVYHVGGRYHAQNPRKRRRNPGKFDRCVADVSRSRSALNPYAVCASRLKPKRRRRNRVVRRTRRRKRNVTRRGSRGQLFSLLARKANQPPMVYTGDKFARHGKPVLFQNLKTAKAVASFMHRQYPVLRGYSIWARAV